jgi:hypothetical protein
MTEDICISTHPALMRPELTSLCICDHPPIGVIFASVMTFLHFATSAFT